jgi:hypothetical protein
MRNAKEAREASESNLVSTTMDKINSAVIRGEFNITTILRFLEIEVLEHEGYIVEAVEVVDPKKHSYKISW